MLRGVDGIRTRDEGFADPCLTTWPRRRALMKQSGRWDSNPRPSPWQGDVLPLNYTRMVGRLLWPRVPRVRIELTTPRFSVACSTN